MKFNIKKILLYTVVIYILLMIALEIINSNSQQTNFSKVIPIHGEIGNNELIKTPIQKLSGDIPDTNPDEILSSKTNEISGDVLNTTTSGDSITSNESSGEINITELIPLTHTHQIKTSDGKLYTANIFIDEPTSYNQIEGITTFRGNNFRDSAFYGSLDINEKTLSKVWTTIIGQTDGWTGVGWNGQPAIIKWDEEVKKQMNLYDEFKEKSDFVEVIYGTLDSHIHFYDLETGKSTRPSIKVESSIKGSVTIDPRGYPLLYVGQGINEVSGESVKMGYHIFSLITGEELYFINGRDSFAYLGWGAFDGNPLLDARSDTLILPGENGVIYLIKLNTNYDKLNGTISLSPTVTRYRYTVNGKAGGIENSIAIYENYAYFLNNNGILQCLDLNTLIPIWNYPMGDDCDATLGLEKESDEQLMIYAATEVDRVKTTAPSYARKINAKTGQVIWEYSCECLYDSSVNGGVLSAPVIGKEKISNMVIYNFSKVTSLRNGKMVALNKENGNVIWEKDLAYYSWSSPVAVYTNSGDAYIIFCNSIGQILLIDASTGETIYTLNTGGGNIEGSPAIYNNKIIIGTRGKRIYCIEIN